MGRRSEQEALRPKATSDAQGNAEHVSAQVDALKGLDLAALRQRWRKLYRGSAPEHLPAWLLRRILAYRIQALAFGDLDRETVRYLEQVAADRERRRAGGERGGRKPPPVPPVPSRRSLRPGTMLVREHGNVLHHVTVMPDGFAWNGTTYRSLSEVAFAITGTNWNGPRFFGLRTKTKANGSVAQDGAAL